MIRINVIVEGKTERSFVLGPMAELFWSHQIDLTPILLGTSGHKGGNTQFDRVQLNVLTILKSDKGAYCTTMFDYYGLGKGFPDSDVGASRSPRERVARIERAWKQSTCSAIPDLRPDIRFIPYLALHEFEALLFTDPSLLARACGHSDAESLLQQVRDAVPTPEDINDSPDTAPSKRIAQVVSGYNKVIDGTKAAQAIGISKMRDQCPHFAQWISQLLAITPIP